MNAMALVGMSAAAKEMSDEERAGIVAVIARDSADVAQAHTDEAGFAFDLTTSVATARG